MRFPSGDHRTLDAPSGAPLTASGCPPDARMRINRVVTLFDCTSRVLTVKTIREPSGEMRSSPISSSAKTSPAVIGRACALHTRDSQPNKKIRVGRIGRSPCYHVRWRRPLGKPPPLQIAAMKPEPVPATSPTNAPGPAVSPASKGSRPCPLPDTSHDHPLVHLPSSQ